MGQDQTSVLEQKTVQIGSAMIQYTLDNFSSFTGAGVADTITMTENITPLDGSPDNGPTPRRADGIASQNVTTTFNMWETSPAKIAAMRGGIDVITSTAGTPVAGATQTIASGGWAYDVPVEIDGQNADGTSPTINSVTGGTDGLLVVRTDYVVQKDNSTGKYSLVLTDSATITTLAQAMVVDYDYTPAVLVEVTTGGLTVADRVGIRITNKTQDQADATVAAELSIAVNDNYNYVVQYDVYYCIVNAGDAITFQPKDATAPTIVYPISLLGESDPDRSLGANLRKISYFNQVIS
jgi:hypothetical protein